MDVSDCYDPTYDQLIYSSYVPYDNIKFIIGQDPLQTTLQHHYSLIHENKVDIVINFKEEGTTKPLNVGKTYHLKDLTLTVHNKNKVLNNLIRTEISLFHTTAKGGQYKHHAILYEFTSWPSDKITSSEETQDLVSAIVLMRQEMKLDKGAIKVMVHDPQSGLRGSAVFLVLYHLLQKVDNSFTENNKIKSSVEKIDVFGTVNRLRNDRAGMIDNYATYKLLFLSLGYYGPNRCALNQLGPLKSSEKSTEHGSKGQHKLVSRKKQNDASYNKSPQILNDEESEYVNYEISDSESHDLFEDYYGEYVISDPEYQNI